MRRKSGGTGAGRGIEGTGIVHAGHYVAGHYERKRGEKDSGSGKRGSVIYPAGQHRRSQHTFCKMRSRGRINCQRRLDSVAINDDGETKMEHTSPSVRRLLRWFSAAPLRFLLVLFF